MYLNSQDPYWPGKQNDKLTHFSAAKPEIDCNDNNGHGDTTICSYQL